MQIHRTHWDVQLKTDGEDCEDESYICEDIDIVVWCFLSMELPAFILQHSRLSNNQRRERASGNENSGNFCKSHYYSITAV